MIHIRSLHHVAIICSDYQRSKRFYTEVLGCTIVREEYRSERQSHKLDLAINGQYSIELFSFPYPPPRVSHPEAAGLRHLAFSVDSIAATVEALAQQGITAEAVRIDEATGKQFTFISDPDGLPIEFYEE
jgi:glyoxylase I family protein